MPNEINFIDLVMLRRIKPDTTVEKFGGLINSSFFDASNALGTLKIKGLVDFTTYVPGQNAITITAMGKQLLDESDTKAKMPFDQLDLTILKQLSTGKRNLADLTTAVNLSTKDLAMHLNKLNDMAYLSADIRNGSLDISLTEKGFMQAKSGMPEQPQQPTSPSQQNPTSQAPQPVQQVHSSQAQAPQQHTQTQTATTPNVQAQPAQPKPATSPSAQNPQAPTQHPQPQPAQQQPQQPQAQPQTQQPQLDHPPEDKELLEMQKQLSSTPKKGNSKMIYGVIIIIIIIILLALFAKGIL